MKINLALILSIITAVGVVALGFTAFQIASERQKLRDDLETKTVRVSEDFFNTHLKSLEKNDSVDLTLINDSVIRKYSFDGAAVYFNSDSIIALSQATKLYLEKSSDYISQVVAADSSMGKLITVSGNKMYEYVKVVKRKDLPSIAAVFYSDAEYIQQHYSKHLAQKFSSLVFAGTGYFCCNTSYNQVGNIKSIK